MDIFFKKFSPFNAEVCGLFRVRSLSSLFLKDDNLRIGELGLGGNTELGFGFEDIGTEPKMLAAEDAGFSLKLKKEKNV